jgi:hypothetical protein
LKSNEGNNRASSFLVTLFCSPEKSNSPLAKRL